LGPGLSYMSLVGGRGRPVAAVGLRGWAAWVVVCRAAPGLPAPSELQCS
jgi:hypothetical protein